MGEIAEAMMDGSLCAECGVFLGEPVGYPRYCNSCHGPMTGGAYSPSQRRRRKSLKDRQWTPRSEMSPKQKRYDNRKRLKRRKRARERAATEASRNE